MARSSFSLRRVSAASSDVAPKPVVPFNAISMIATFAASFLLAVPLLATTDAVDAMAEFDVASIDMLPVTGARDVAYLPSIEPPVRNVRRLLHDGESLAASTSSVTSGVASRTARGSMVVQSSEGASTSAMRSAARRRERLLAMEEEGDTPQLTHAAATKPPVNPYNKIGVYMTASSAARDDFVDETIADLKESGGSTFVVDVKGYWVYYHSLSPKAEEEGMIHPIYDLPAVLNKAKESGLYTIARFIAVKDEGLTEKRPDLQLRQKTKGYYINQGWIDPSNEEALEYNDQLLCELASYTDLDEINLDYIRMSSSMPYSTGYTGDEKAEKLMHFIKMARNAIDRCGPTTKLGVSTYAILGWNFPANRETIGQDVVQYAPYVDVISPMAYPATFSVSGYYAPGKHPVSRMYWLVYRTLTGYADLLGPDHAWKLRPWIQAYSVNQKNVTDQMNAVVDAGFCGFTFWNANNNFGTVYSAMQHWSQPDRCKSTVVSVGEPKHGAML